MAESQPATDCGGSASSTKPSSFYSTPSLSIWERLRNQRGEAPTVRVSTPGQDNKPSISVCMTKKQGEFCNLDEGDFKSWVARRIAFKVAPSVVGLSSFVGGKDLFACSGTIVEWDDMAGTILTSATLLTGGSDEVPSNLKVMVHLPTHEKVEGTINHYDLHHNVAVITLPSASQLHVATFPPHPMPFCPGQSVVALGRHVRTYNLMASSGEYRLAKDDFDSEDLLYSSCKITQHGIGGPLVDILSGFVLGMNFTDGKSTVFLPSTLLLRCLKHFKSYGSVYQPWIGMRTRDLDFLKMRELESIYQKFPCIHGIFVEEVIKGSPADSAGVCSGDIVIHCDRIPIHSRIQFIEILFDKAENSMEASCNKGKDYGVKKSKIATELDIARRSSGCIERMTITVDKLSPLERNRWPLYRPGELKKYYH